MHKFIIADNQDITRVGLNHLLYEQKITDSTLKVANKKELIFQLQLYPSAVIILDYTLFDMEDVSELAILEQRFAKAQWILFSDELSSKLIKRVISECKNIGIVMKDSPLAEIQAAIYHATHQNRYLCQQINSFILTDNKTSTNIPSSEEDIFLTASEKKILKEIALGKTTKEIAVEKNLSFHTINSHRKNIFRKLSVNNVHEATKYALRAGIIDIAEYCI